MMGFLNVAQSFFWTAASRSFSFFIKAPLTALSPCANAVEAARNAANARQTAFFIDPPENADSMDLRTRWLGGLWRELCISHRGGFMKLVGIVLIVFGVIAL